MHGVPTSAVKTDRVLGGEPVDRGGDELGVQRAIAVPGRGEPVQPGSGPADSGRSSGPGAMRPPWP